MMIDTLLLIVAQRCGTFACQSVQSPGMARNASELDTLTFCIRSSLIPNIDYRVNYGPREVFQGSGVSKEQQKPEPSSK